MLKKFLKILFLTWRLKFPIYDNLKLATISLELSKEKKKKENSKNLNIPSRNL